MGAEPDTTGKGEVISKIKGKKHCQSSFVFLSVSQLDGACLE